MSSLTRARLLSGAPSPAPCSRGRRAHEREAEEQEVDRILAKTRAEGLASLTEAEKATLRATPRAAGPTGEHGAAQV